METCRRAENMSWMGAKVNAIRMLNVENLVLVYLLVYINISYTTINIIYADIYIIYFHIFICFFGISVIINSASE